MKRITLFACLVCVGCLPKTYYDPFDDWTRGLRYFDRGQYENALSVWRPMAEEGDCDAQYSLGVLYFQGVGIDQDYGQALAWWKRAADQGQPDAQQMLGDLSYQGPDVERRCPGCSVSRDLTIAYVWYRLGERSAVYGTQEKYLAKILPEIRGEMSPEEVARGDSAVGSWSPTPRLCKPRHLL